MVAHLVVRIAAQIVVQSVAQIVAQIVAQSVAQIAVKTRTLAQIGTPIGAETRAAIVDRIDVPTGATKMVAREIESASVHRYTVRFA